MRRNWLGVLVTGAALAACGGGGGEGPESASKDSIPGVDATGTADTEIFTDSPDTVGVQSTTPPPQAGDGSAGPPGVDTANQTHAP